jgi:hypothetical protein
MQCLDPLLVGACRRQERCCTDYVLKEWNGLCPAAASAGFYEVVDTVAVEARDTSSIEIENARWDGAGVPDRRLTGMISRLFQTERAIARAHIGKHKLREDLEAFDVSR